LIEIIIVISLVLTFYFSGTETAFLSVNRVRIELWRRQKNRAAEIIFKFLLKPERFIYTTLIGNNIANVAFASYATIYLHHYIDEKLTWLLITTVTIVFGEIIPKTLFRSLADWIVRKVAYLLQFFYYLFLPVIWMVNHISRIVLRFLKYSHSEFNDFFSKRDIEILIRESRKYADLDEEESKILARLFNFRSLRVREAQIPRTEIIAVEENTSLDDLSTVFQKSGFTKIPVFRENLDNIIGVVFLKDLFLQPQSLPEMIRDIMFVPETKHTLQLMREFRKENITIAIVVDEYGGTAGLVTSEDLIEELVGEIIDEYDEASAQIRVLGENLYSVNARIEPERLKAELGIELPEGNYETLAGFILSYLGHIPKRDETFTFDGFKFTVSRATRRKVDWVRILLPRD
jgi:putative hemolysin